jgi:hypothetical protein
VLNEMTRSAAGHDGASVKSHPFRRLVLHGTVGDYRFRDRHNL